MKIDLLQEDKAAIWRPETELEDPAHVKDAMADLKSSGLKTLFLDLIDKEWLSSSEIGVVMWIYKELDGIGGTLSILAVSPFVLKTINVTGIDQLLTVFDSLDKALDAIKG
ncbi:STAS domain-containing protein [bacterium]|nr:STAS domain-containing protein [bacterium]